MTTPTLPLEPDPQHWLTTERRALFKHQFERSASLLRQSGLWRATIGYWVRWQVALESDWPQVDDEPLLDQLVQQWYSEHPSEAVGLTPQELRDKLRVGPAVSRWSRIQWGHRLESLFLQRKSQLDRASCRLLRLKSKYLALEVYHRIKSGETSFETAAREFGLGPERHHGGLLSLQPLEKMPFGLAPLLEKLEVGRLSMPMRLGSVFCLVQLESFQPTRLDAETEEFLLAEQLRLWTDGVVDTLVAGLV